MRLEFAIRDVDEWQKQGEACEKALTLHFWLFQCRSEALADDLRKLINEKCLFS